LRLALGLLVASGAQYGRGVMNVNKAIEVVKAM
jgi:hypothetical protein